MFILFVGFNIDLEASQKDAQLQSGEMSSAAQSTQMSQSSTVTKNLIIAGVGITCIGLVVAAIGESIRNKEIENKHQIEFSQRTGVGLRVTLMPRNELNRLLDRHTKIPRHRIKNPVNHRRRMIHR